MAFPQKRICIIVPSQRGLVNKSWLKQTIISLHLSFWSFFLISKELDLVFLTHNGNPLKRVRRKIKMFPSLQISFLFLESELFCDSVDVTWLLHWLQLWLPNNSGKWHNNTATRILRQASACFPWGRWLEIARRLQEDWRDCFTFVYKINICSSLVLQESLPESTHQASVICPSISWSWTIKSSAWGRDGIIPNTCHYLRHPFESRGLQISWSLVSIILNFHNSQLPTINLARWN